MADTSVTYVGDGIQTTYSVPFEYLSESYVKVAINGIDMLTPAVWYFSGSSIIFRNAPADGSAIKIYRQTQGDTRLVNFQNGAVLTEADLDLSADQLFHLVQEAKENFADLINAEILRIGGGLGIVSTDPDEIIANLVAQVLADSVALELSQRVQDIDDNGQATLDMGTALQSQLNALAGATAATVYVQAGEPIPGVGGVPDPIQEGARWYDTDDNNKAYVYSQTSSTWVDLSDPRIGANTADITALEVTVNDGATGVAATAAALAVLDTTVTNIDGVQTAQAASIVTLQSDVGANSASIISESSTRATNDTAIASELALLGVKNGAATAFILDTATVKIDSDVGDTVATRLSGLATTDAANTAAISAEETARIAADAAEAVSRTALAARVTTAEGNILTNAAAVVTEANARASAIAAEAALRVALDARVTTAEGSISSAQVSISANASAITNAETGITDLEARYGVALDVNGYISGFSLNNSGTVSDFTIIADKFTLLEGAAPGETPKSPFSVSGGVVTMQNVQINGNLVVNGTINSAQIADEAVNEFYSDSVGSVLGPHSTWKTGAGTKEACRVTVPVASGPGQNVITVYSDFEVTGSSSVYGSIVLKRTRNGITTTLISGMGDLAAFSKPWSHSKGSMTYIEAANETYSTDYFWETSQGGTSNTSILPYSNLRTQVTYK